jgi:hypothetical protein
MLIEAEDIATIEADALKDAVTIEQTVVKHGHLGLCVVDKFAIEIDLHRPAA